MIGETPFKTWLELDELQETETNTAIASAARLRDFCLNVLHAIGVDEPSAHAATDAMMHGSIHGVDSHGVRLLDHYVRVFQGGRINKSPVLRHELTKAGTAVLDADHAHGARATYAALDIACDLVKDTGIAAVGIRNSSHFGPAGAYTYSAAKRGMLALCVCNSDSFVRLHDGAERFHGTNPISVALPSGGENPWHFDMATSAIPFNRVRLYRSLDQELPEGVASDERGANTINSHEAEMLAPVGGDFGFKGAGLAGIAEIFSAVLTGMRLSPDILPMGGDEISTPRELGAFVMVLDPTVFIGAELFQAGIQRYLQLLRASSPREGKRVLAPGDREWDVATLRKEQGIPLDPETVSAMHSMSKEYAIGLPF